jgi:hypothetical protein
MKIEYKSDIEVAVPYGTRVKCVRSVAQPTLVGEVGVTVNDPTMPQGGSFLDVLFDGVLHGGGPEGSFTMLLDELEVLDEEA